MPRSADIPGRTALLLKGDGGVDLGKGDVREMGEGGEIDVEM